ncbi:MAG: TraR/DksA family transcriptional regulator [Treponema sp.]|nr:TraR/DksA family transcriptional regulator [Treponema sp.]MBR1615473.1 TraR/DksA family transcriptional regulator [Treponema sp.]MBR1713540.1 TraR/DksA family transcriptional regulator [Treponema sp.]
MEKEFIDRMQEKLLADKAELMKALADQYAESKKIVEAGESGDEADIASDVVDGKMLESLGKKDSNKLQMINNALDRIKQGKYGFCLVCKKEIPLERLEAIPYAFMCVNCQSVSERRNR